MRSTTTLRKRKTIPVSPKKENRVTVLVTTSGAKKTYGYGDSGKSPKQLIVKRNLRKQGRKRSEMLRF